MALPAELSAEDRQALAFDLGGALVARHGVAADVCIHAPGRGGDERNHHAHILLTTRRMTPEGLTDKTRELDNQRSGEVDYWRAEWAAMANRALERQADLNGSTTGRWKSRASSGCPRPTTAPL